MQSASLPHQVYYAVVPAEEGVRWCVWGDPDDALVHRLAVLGHGPQQCVHSADSAAEARDIISSLGHNTVDESPVCRPGASGDRPTKTSDNKTMVQIADNAPKYDPPSVEGEGPTQSIITENKHGVLRLGHPGKMRTGPIFELAAIAWHNKFAEMDIFFDSLDSPYSFVRACVLACGWNKYHISLHGNKSGSITALMTLIGHSADMNVHSIIDQYDNDPNMDVKLMVSMSQQPKGFDDKFGKVVLQMAAARTASQLMFNHLAVLGVRLLQNLFAPNVKKYNIETWKNHWTVLLVEMGAAVNYRMQQFENLYAQVQQEVNEIVSDQPQPVFLEPQPNVLKLLHDMYLGCHTDEITFAVEEADAAGEPRMQALLALLTLSRLNLYKHENQKLSDLLELVSTGCSRKMDAGKQWGEFESLKQHHEQWETNKLKWIEYAAIEFGKHHLEQFTAMCNTHLKTYGKCANLINRIRQADVELYTTHSVAVYFKGLLMNPELLQHKLEIYQGARKIKHTTIIWSDKHREGETVERCMKLLCGDNLNTSKKEWKVFHTGATDREADHIGMKMTPQGWKFKGLSLNMRYADASSSQISSSMFSGVVQGGRAPLVPGKITQFKGKKGTKFKTRSSDYGSDNDYSDDDDYSDGDDVNSGFYSNYHEDTYNSGFYSNDDNDSEDNNGCIGGGGESDGGGGGGSGYGGGGYGGGGYGGGGNGGGCIARVYVSTENESPSWAGVIPSVNKTSWDPPKVTSKPKTPQEVSRLRRNPTNETFGLNPDKQKTSPRFTSEPNTPQKVSRLPRNPTNETFGLNPDKQKTSPRFTSEPNTPQKVSRLSINQTNVNTQQSINVPITSELDIKRVVFSKREYFEFVYNGTWRPGSVVDKLSIGFECCQATNSFRWEGSTLAKYSRIMMRSELFCESSDFESLVFRGCYTYNETQALLEELIKVESVNIASVILTIPPANLAIVLIAMKDTEMTTVLSNMEMRQVCNTIQCVPEFMKLYVLANYASVKSIGLSDLLQVVNTSDMSLICSVRNALGALFIQAIRAKDDVTQELLYFITLHNDEATIRLLCMCLPYEKIDQIWSSLNGAVDKADNEATNLAGGVASGLEAADEVEKMALVLDAAAKHKLELEGMQKDKEAKAAAVHKVADKLQQQGHSELAVMVHEVVKEVERALAGETYIKTDHTVTLVNDVFCMRQAENKIETLVKLMLHSNFRDKATVVALVNSNAKIAFLDVFDWACEQNKGHEVMYELLCDDQTTPDENEKKMCFVLEHMNKENVGKLYNCTIDDTDKDSVVIAMLSKQLECMEPNLACHIVQNDSTRKPYLDNLSSDRWLQLCMCLPAGAAKSRMRGQWLVKYDSACQKKIGNLCIDIHKAALLADTMYVRMKNQLTQYTNQEEAGVLWDTIQKIELKDENYWSQVERASEMQHPEAVVLTVLRKMTGPTICDTYDSPFFNMLEDARSTYENLHPGIVFPGLYAIGQCYLLGKWGVTKDDSMAVKYFTWASRDKDSMAVAALANCYVYGTGIDTNIGSAVLQLALIVKEMRENEEKTIEDRIEVFSTAHEECLKILADASFRVKMLNSMPAKYNVALGDLYYAFSLDTLEYKTYAFMHFTKGEHESEKIVKGKKIKIIEYDTHVITRIEELKSKVMDGNDSQILSNVMHPLEQAAIGALLANYGNYLLIRMTEPLSIRVVKSMTPDQKRATAEKHRSDKNKVLRLFEDALDKKHYTVVQNMVYLLRSGELLHRVDTVHGNRPLTSYEKKEKIQAFTERTNYEIYAIELLVYTAELIFQDKTSEPNKSALEDLTFTAWLRDTTYGISYTYVKQNRQYMSCYYLDKLALFYLTGDITMKCPISCLELRIASCANYVDNGDFDRVQPALYNDLDDWLKSAKLSGLYEPVFADRIDCLSTYELVGVLKKLAEQLQSSISKLSTEKELYEEMMNQSMKNQTVASNDIATAEAVPVTRFLNKKGNRHKVQAIQAQAQDQATVKTLATKWLLQYVADQAKHKVERDTSEALEQEDRETRSYFLRWAFYLCKRLSHANYAPHKRDLGRLIIHFTEELTLIDKHNEPKCRVNKIYMVSVNKQFPFTYVERSTPTDENITEYSKRYITGSAVVPTKPHKRLHKNAVTPKPKITPKPKKTPSHKNAVTPKPKITPLQPNRFSILDGLDETHVAALDQAAQAQADANAKAHAYEARQEAEAEEARKAAEAEEATQEAAALEARKAAEAEEARVFAARQARPAREAEEARVLAARVLAARVLAAQEAEEARVLAAREAEEARVLAAQEAEEAKIRELKKAGKKIKEAEAKAEAKAKAKAKAEAAEAEAAQAEAAKAEAKAAKAKAAKAEAKAAKAAKAEADVKAAEQAAKAEADAKAKAATPEAKAEAKAEAEAAAAKAEAEAEAAEAAEAEAAAAEAEAAKAVKDAKAKSNADAEKARKKAEEKAQLRRAIRKSLHQERNDAKAVKEAEAEVTAAAAKAIQAKIKVAAQERERIRNLGL